MILKKKSLTLQSDHSFFTYIMPVNTIYKCLSAALMLNILPMSASAYDFSVPNSAGDTIYYNVVSSKEVEVTCKTRFLSTPSYTDHVKIPSTVSHEGTEYEVTSIGERAFFDCRGLEKLSLPDGIKSVGKWAFAWCDALSSLTLPKSVETVSADAFDGCYSLDAIYSSAQELLSDNGVLLSRDRMKLIAFPPAYEGRYDIPITAREIADHAFGGCTFLKEVTIPQYTNVIGKNAFYFCNWLKKVNIPASVTEIGDGAFADCASLISITVSSANANYSSHSGLLYDKGFTTLIQCPGAVANDVDIPSTVRTIGHYAFFRNLGISSIALPEGVTEIAEGAFLDCQSLYALQLPASIKKIGTLSISMCSRLRAIYVAMQDPSEIEMGDEVFADTDVDNCMLYVPKGTVMKYRNAPQWSRFKNVFEIGDIREQIISWEDQVDSIESYTESIQLRAVASSGLPVSYSVSPQSEGYGYISGDSLIITSMGEIAITANQNGSNTFYPAPPSTFVFHVAKSDIRSPESQELKVYGTIGKIVIKGTEEKELVRVFSVSGMMIYSGYDTEIPVDMRGVYIVSLRNQAFKVAVR